MPELVQIKSDSEGQVVRTTMNYMREAEIAKKSRMDKNEVNYDVFHMRQNYAHKMEGQSREFLSKQPLAVEQISSFFQQGLVDVENWFNVENAPGIENDDVFMQPQEVRAILEQQLGKTDFLTKVKDGVQMGLLGSLIIMKVGGKKVDSVKFETKEVESDFTEEGGASQQVLERVKDEKWCLDLSLIRQQDYYPDPTGNDLYVLEESYMDFHKVEKLSQGENALFDPAAVALLKHSFDEEEDDKLERAKETGQDVVSTDFRRKIKLTEGWGTILDDRGNVVHENVNWVIGNDRVLLMKPRMNPFWHGKKPYVAVPIMRVAKSVWHKALMDAPSENNLALNELYNLVVDGAMSVAHNVKVVRSDWLEDDGEVSDGIRPGQTLRANSSMPAGAKLLETVDTGKVSQEALAIFNLMNSEFNQSALTNDLRLGQMPQRSVKATEVVEASNSITSLFTGIAKGLEVELIERVLDMAWMTILQNFSDFNDSELASILGRDRAQELSVVPKEVRFAKSAMGHKFKVFGVSRILTKTKDFRKLTTMLQVIGSSEVLIQEFARKFDFGLLLQDILRSLDIDTSRLTMSPEDQAEIFSEVQGLQERARGGPDNLSQTPNAPTDARSQTNQIPRGGFEQGPRQ